MKKIKFSMTVLALIAAFSVFGDDLNGDWDAFGHPTHPPTDRRASDMGGDWDAYGHPR